MLGGKLECVCFVFTPIHEHSFFTILALLNNNVKLRWKQTTKQHNRHQPAQPRPDEQLLTPQQHLTTFRIQPRTPQAHHPATTHRRSHFTSHHQATNFYEADESFPLNEEQLTRLSLFPCTAKTQPPTGKSRWVRNWYPCN